MKKQFITEAQRLQKLAGIITESQERDLNENVDNLRQIWEKAVEDDRDNLEENPPEDPKVSYNFEQAVADARYSNIDELAQSLVNTLYTIEEEYEIDFGDAVDDLIRICKGINFNNTPELIKAYINFYYGDYYNDEEKEEYYNDFRDKL